MMLLAGHSVRERAMQDGKCLGCADCSGSCREILDLITVPVTVLKTKGAIK